MKIRHSTSLIAMVALMGATGFAMAGTSNTFDASVSVLSPDQSGFLIGGQVSVGGVGQGSLTLSRSSAEMTLTGGASSQLDPIANGDALDGVTSLANITSALDFSRSISTTGSLVGLGSVVSRGEAIGALGSAGAASANTTTAGTRAAGTLGVNGDAGGEGNATAEASAQGSLNGSLSTSNTLSLLGTSGLFAGSNSLTVGEKNTALAYGSANILADGNTGINLNSATLDIDNLGASGNGGLFKLTSILNNSNSNIAMNVNNAGNGTISLSTSTGGFFTGGGAAAGSASMADTNEFFSPTFTTNN